MSPALQQRRARLENDIGDDATADALILAASDDCSDNIGDLNPDQLDRLERLITAWTGGSRG